MSNWRISKQEAYELVGKETAEKMKGETNLKWDEVANIIVKVKTREMVSNYIGNILDSVFNNISIEAESLENEFKYKPTNKFKIREEFANNQTLLDILRRYQILTEYDSSIYQYNSLTYALKQTNKFDENILNQMNQINLENESITKYLNRFGKEFNLCFKVIRYSEKSQKWNDILSGDRIIGSENGDVINLALFETHFILNELIDGISAYALKNYRLINEKCTDKPEEYKLKVAKLYNGRYMISAKQAHIRSYNLINLTTYQEYENLV